MGSELSRPGSGRPPEEPPQSWGERRERKAVERKARVDGVRQAQDQERDHQRRLTEQRNKGQRTVYGVAVIKDMVNAVDDIVGDDPYLEELTRPLVERKGVPGIADQI